jgi:hypothetical protein
MHTPRFDGVVGPLFLLVLPFIAGMRPLPVWVRTILIYAGLTFLFWASGSQQLRFLIPVFPFLALATGFIVAHYRPKKALAGLLLVIIAASLAYNGVHLYREFMSIRPVGVVFGTESRSDFLRRSVSSYDIYQYINSTLPADAKLFLVSMKGMTFLCDRTCYSDTMMESYTLQQILSRSASPADVQRALREQGFTHLLYDSNYVLGEKSMLTPSEKALFAEFRDKYLKLLHQDHSYYLSLL